MGELMKYLSITLKGFRRSIKQYIRLVPKSALQLILGPNGSGKSSFLREISPLPPEKDAFMKEGYKELKILYNDEIYKLRYEIGNTINCYFYKKQEDGNYINLNNGRTQSVQLKLIEEYFHYDKSIHSLVHGTEKFTDMSPQRRREYFTSICDVNYDYALNIWKKSKDQLRDVQGTIKRVKQILINEKDRADNTNQEEIENIIKLEEEHISKLQNELTVPTDKNYNEVESIADGLIDKINKNTTTILKLRTIIDSNKSKLNKKELGIEIDKLEKEILKIEGEVNQLTKTFESAEKEILKIKGMSQETFNKKKLLLNGIELEQKKVFSNIKKICVNDIELFVNRETDYSNLLCQIDNISPLITKLLIGIPTLTEQENINFHTCLKETEETIFNQKELLKRNCNKRDIAIGKLEEMKKNKLASSKVQCPNCNYEWILDQYSSRIEKGESIVNQLSEEIKRINKVIEEKEERLSLMNEKLFILNSIKNKIHEYNELTPYLWCYFTKEKLNTDPMKLINVMDELSDKLQLASDYQKITKQFANLESELSSVKISDENNIQQIHLRMTNIENEVLKLQNIKENKNNLKNIYVKLLNAFNNLEKIHTQLKEDMVELNDNQYLLIRLTFKNEIIKIIRYKQAKIGELVKQLNEISGRKKIIDNYEKQLSSLQEEEKILKIIVKELSPTTGLIADGLIGFINDFLLHMNTIINNVWTYTLEIKSPEVEEGSGEINYKFPLFFADRNETINDISLGSTGIKEVVNMAFKLVAMKKLYIENYPLFLDESGASFDFKHRQQIASLIKSILDQQTHEQIFMVSHYADSYGSLVSADVTVFSKDNIIIPKDEYNECVSFSEEM